MLLDLTRRQHDLVTTTVDPDMPMIGATLDFVEVLIWVGLLIDCVAEIYLGFYLSI
jgi:hypothetical protein